MATQATAQILAKGPLSSALGQWMFLGFGTFVIFTGDNGVSIAAKEIASVAFRLVTGRDGFSGAALLREAALNNPVALHQANAGGQSQPQQPIVIHSVSDARSGKGWTATIVQLTLGAGGCWAAYIVFSNYLPDQIKEMLPVTRKFFESAVTSLGNGILQVRDALSEQIAAVTNKQDELGIKQDKTHDQVLGLKDDIGDVRLHIDDIAVAISRCESSLGDAAGRQTYMSNGVRLLVQCVGDLLRPSNPAVAEELDQFSRMGSEVMGDDFHYNDSIDSSSPDKKYGQQFECPSSPILSEIGSTTSTVMDDHHHHHSNMRSHMLRPRRSQSIATPTSSGNTAHPNRTSNVTTHKKVVSPSPPSLLGMPRMLQSFGSRRSVSNTTATTGCSSSMASSDSSPENELPQSNYQEKPLTGQMTPSSSSDAADLSDVSELLRSFERSGRM